MKQLHSEGKRKEIGNKDNSVYVAVVGNLDRMPSPKAPAPMQCKKKKRLAAMEKHPDVLRQDTAKHLKVIRYNRKKSEKIEQRAGNHITISPGTPMLCMF